MNKQVDSTPDNIHGPSNIFSSLCEKIRLRLSYAYRLSAAKLIIFRLRIVRYYRQFLSSTGMTGRWIVGGVMAGCFISAAVGYLLGTHKQSVVDAASQTVSYAPPTPMRQKDPLGASGHSTTSDVLELAPPEPLLLSAPASDNLAASALNQSEIDHLRSTVGELTKKITSLEEETYSLESELLEQQLSFSNAEQQWSEQQVETRVVYNITNIPVGGYVSADEGVDFLDLEPATYIAQDTYVDQAYDESYLVDQTFASTETEEDINNALTLAYEAAYEAIEQLGGEDMSVQDFNASMEYTAQPYAPGAQGVGAAERWAIDGYIDGVGNGVQVYTGNQNVAADQGDYPYGTEAEEGYPTEGSYSGQSSFYGPAEHRYEDLILPGYEATPEQAQQYNSQ